MKRPLNLRNSIYQKSGAYGDLTVKDGMLINNRPDGQTGIAQAVQVKKSLHRAEKISTISTAFAMGEMMSDMGGDCCN